MRPARRVRDHLSTKACDAKPRDSHSIQAQIEPVCYDYPNRCVDTCRDVLILTGARSRVQRRDGDLQERQVQRVGCRRAGQDQAAVEALLHRHSGPGFRG